MREEFGLALAYSGFLGITPAHAGRMSVPLYNNFVNQDHPRACGKNANNRFYRIGRVGSPPRMREEY